MPSLNAPAPYTEGKCHFHVTVWKDERTILDIDPEAQRWCTPRKAPPLSSSCHAAGCDPPSMGVDPVLGGDLRVPCSTGLQRERAPLLPDQLYHPLHLHGILPSARLPSSCVLPFAFPCTQAIRREMRYKLICVH